LSNGLPQKDNLLKKRFRAHPYIISIETAIDEVLNEAKKDHPLNQNLDFSPETTIPEINRIMNYKQQEWFKKWFNGVK
jgi:hypothetical protein